MNVKRMSWSIVVIVFITLVAGLAGRNLAVPSVSHGSSTDVASRSSTAFLVGSPSFSALQGKASLQTRGSDQVFGLSVSAASAATLATVEAFVHGMRVGTLHLDDEGAGNLELSVRTAFPPISGHALVELRTPQGALVASGLLD